MRDIRGLCLLVILMVSVDGILRGLHFMKRDETGTKCDDRQEKEVRIREKLSGVEKILWGRSDAELCSDRRNSSPGLKGSAGNERGGDLT
jgi:hypothetical protein